MINPFKSYYSRNIHLIAVMLFISATFSFAQNESENEKKFSLYYSPSLNLLRINGLNGFLLVNETGLKFSNRFSLSVAFNYLFTPIETNSVKVQDSDEIKRKFHMINSGLRAGYTFYNSEDISMNSSLLFGPALIFFVDDGYKWKENLESLYILNPQLSISFKIDDVVSLNAALGYLINLKSNLRFIDQSDLNTFSIGLGLIIGD